ncbi:hypothetical protein pb186bvf_009610 [Paramecium bursaria]
MAYFEENETQFLTRMEKVQKCFSQYPLSSNKQALIVQLSSLIKEANQQLQFMMIEVKECRDLQKKSQLEGKIKKYNKQYKEVNQNMVQLQNERENMNQKQDKLFGVQVQKQQDQKTKLIGQTYDLQDVDKIANETLDLTNHINANIRNQNNQLLQASEQNKDIGQDLTKINSQVKTMSYREEMSKLIKICIIGILTIGNIFLLCDKFS